MIDTILLIAALLLLIAAAVNVKLGSLHLGWAGLACWVAASLI